MASKQFLSTYQIMLIVLFCNISTAVFFVPGEITGIIGQVAWIAIIVATIISALVVYYPLAALGCKYPEKTIIEYSQDILGKFFGKIIAFIFVYYFFQLHGWTLSEFAAVSNSLLPETPPVVFHIIMSLLTIYAVREGPEVIGRCGEFVFPIGLLFLTVTVVSSIPDMKFDNLLPISEYGLFEILHASIPPLDWLTIGFVFGMFPITGKKCAQLKRNVLISIILSGVLLAIITVTNIGVFGDEQLENQYFPFLILARYTPIIGFERAEAIVIMYWITWIFIRTAVYSYAAVTALKLLINLSDWRIYILPETILAIAYSTYQYENFVEQSYLFASAHFYYLLFSLVLPFAVWVIALTRSRFR